MRLPWSYNQGATLGAWDSTTMKRIRYSVTRLLTQLSEELPGIAAPAKLEIAWMRHLSACMPRLGDRGVG